MDSDIPVTHWIKEAEVGDEAARQRKVRGESIFLASKVETVVILRLIVFLFTIQQQLAVAQPNIVLILTDDQGYGDVGIHGNPWLKTPNLDRIAKEGARLDRFFVEPVCAPTRAALLSGRYPTKVGVTGVTRNREMMRGEEITIAEVLRDAGFATGCFGKWHNGANWPHHPNAQGFSEFVGFCGGHWNDYYDPILEKNGEPFQAKGFIADILTDHALKFIEREKDGPFFCYIPLNTPHTPASARLDDWAHWKDRDDVESDFDKCMYALVENIDENMGRVLGKLAELKLEKDTIVAFLTDNGPNGERFNGDMLGRKGSVHEGGVRVPCFIRWPGEIAPNVIAQNVAHIDLLPTLCSMVGVSVTQKVDGIDVSAALMGEKFDWPERNLYTLRALAGKTSQWSIRSARYRATEKTLHDLIKDPRQKDNLSATRPEAHQQLLADFIAWRETAMLTNDPLPVHIGHAEWPRVTIKAHEFELSPAAKNGIDYCDRNGWANQWIEKWTDPNAFAECPVRVVEGGKYRVRFRYTAPPEAVGSIFRLQVGDAAMDIHITKPFESNVRPAEQQSENKGKGYLSRDWTDFIAGEIELSPGESPLTLRIEKRPAAEMPAFKAVVFERID